MKRTIFCVLYTINIMPFSVWGMKKEGDLVTPLSTPSPISHIVSDETTSLIGALAESAHTHGVTIISQQGKIIFRYKNPESITVAIQHAYKDIDKALFTRIFHREVRVSLSEGISSLCEWIVHNDRLTPCSHPGQKTSPSYFKIDRPTLLKNLTVFYLISQNNLPGMYQWMILHKMEGDVFKGKTGYFPFFSSSPGMYASKVVGKDSVMAGVLEGVAFLHVNKIPVFELFVKKIAEISRK